MDFLTIVGYVIAALAIALGLYLMLRKNVASQNTTTVPEQSGLDENDQNSVNDDNDSHSMPVGGRIPVVPRHVRDQIGAQQAAQSVAATSSVRSTADHAEMDDLLAQAPTIKAARVDEKLNDEGHESKAVEDITDADATEVKGKTATPVEQQGQTLAESSKPDQDPVEDAFDQALAQLEAATSTNDDLDTTEQTAKPDSPAKTDIDTLATADVEEWQGESALLDAHLQDQERRDDESALAQAEHIVALYVMPNASRTLTGERTIHLLRQFGLRYGEMSLFHRFQDSDGTGPLMFSVLRYTSEGPSGFDLETLPSEQVEGLAFFLALPGKHAVAGYDTMVSISTLLAREIHGQVYDEHMNQLSPQSREHYRHFVLEYRTPV